MEQDNVKESYDIHVALTEPSSITGIQLTGRCKAFLQERKKDIVNSIQASNVKQDTVSSAPKPSAQLSSHGVFSLKNSLNGGNPVGEEGRNVFSNIMSS
jgi:hypothetical protein